MNFNELTKVMKFNEFVYIENECYFIETIGESKTKKN